MILQDGLLIFFAAIIGSSINAVAGGGGFISYPSLIVVGLNPLNANAIGTVALWPGNIASVKAYSGDFNYKENRIVSLIVAITIGGLLGAGLAVQTSPAVFKKLIPFFLLFTWLLFAFSSQLLNYFASANAKKQENKNNSVMAFLILLVTGIYGGYFGAGLGMMLLTIFTFLGYKNLNEMNGLKVLLVSFNNGIAAFTFIFSGLVIWQYTLIMLAGALIGGYYGAKVTRRMPQSVLKKFIIVIGGIITVLFFINEFLNKS